MQACSYCKKEATLTKEHIWPRCLIQRLGPAMTYEPRSEKFHGGEPVVKDVCALCNNEKLCVLDDYICDIFDKFMAQALPPGSDGRLKYDYHLLLRGLLKISFNSARAMKEDIAIKTLARYANYILNGGLVRNVTLRLQVVTSARSISIESGSETLFEPYIFRNAQIAYDGVLSKRFLIRLVAINSYWFYLIFSLKDEPAHKWKELFRGLSTWQTPTGVIVPKSKSGITIKASKTTYFHPALLGKLVLANDN